MAGGPLVMRAVENRVTLVKADGAYDSAVIAPSGEIVAKAVSSEGMQTMLLADVPLGTGDTLFVRLGDWVGWLCIAGILFFMALGPAIDLAQRMTSRAPSSKAHLRGQGSR